MNRAILLLCLALSFASAEQSVSGYLRSMYIGNSNADALAVGGSVEIQKRFGDFSANIGFFNSTPIGNRDDGVSELFSHTKSGYTTLGIASISYKKDFFELKIGRQRVSTPLVDLDDGRIIPNLFEGVSAKYKNGPLQLESYYLSKMSGFWSEIYSGLDMSKFRSMSESAGYGDVTKSGLYILGGSYNDGKFKATLYGYSSLNLLNLYYAELALQKESGKSSGVIFGIQGKIQRETGKLHDKLNLKDKTIDEESYGVKLGGYINELEFYGAVTKVSNSRGKRDKSLFNVWAGIPEYTVFNENVMKSFQTDGATLLKGHIGYSFGGGIDGSVAHIYVDGKTNVSKPVNVSEITLSKKIKNLSLIGVMLFKKEASNYLGTTIKTTLEYRF